MNMRLMVRTRSIETSTRLIRIVVATAIEAATVEQEDTTEVAVAAVVDVVVAVAVIKDEVVAVAEESTINTPLINNRDNNNQVDTNRITIITTKVGISINSRGIRRMATPTKGFHRHHRGGELHQRLQLVRTPIPRCEITVMGVHGDVRDTETTSLRAPMNPIIAWLRSTRNQP